MRRHFGNRRRCTAAFFAALFIFQCHLAFAEDEERIIRVWFNAFIPSATETSDGSYLVKNGQTFLVDPLIKSYCYSTDNRDFSSDRMASSRLTVDLTFSVKRRSLVLLDESSASRVRIGATHKYRCLDLVEVEGSPRTTSTDCVKVSPVRESARWVDSMGITAGAPNPFFQVFGEACVSVNLNFSARIDLDVVIAYDILSRKLILRGTTGVFPAFEGYYQIDNGSVKTIFRRKPQGSPMYLLDFGLGLNAINFEEIVHPFD